MRAVPAGGTEEAAAEAPVGVAAGRLHAAAPEVDPEERALLAFAVAFKGLLRGRMRDAVCVRAEACVARGDLPEEALTEEPIYRWWSAALRAQQDFYVDVTAAIVDRQLEALAATARTIARDPGPGSLTLDPSVRVPTYQAAVDIHCVPGSYFLERIADDVGPGARSELGSLAFAMGRHGAMNEDKGVVAAEFARSFAPDLAIRRILDLGCTIGMSTLAWCDAFPAAEVHAVDVSAPCLRYGHARARALGRCVHFRQADAEALPYPDGSFDVVASHILLHETSRAALPRIFAECHRVLVPGGAMVHVEVPIRDLDPAAAFLARWDAWNNNEPFWGHLAGLDLAGLCVQAGFPQEGVVETVVPSAHQKAGGWLVLAARKPA
ncbi:class I SAM-dependent methyltransferase [Thermaurantiacus tibetensis]|uniref:class I SAM-dependent methyltransferase n=1 Tax=Thermaurantiacus tibetensis TaxID=2759035 RepID=UPI00189092E3|nr:class I SAM-dependent methyltransferase [Thermaurantiacus tibetensis]